MSNERIHVVVTSHDAASFVARCLDSVRSQTWRELDVVVVDDSSRDGSAEIARSICRADSRFRLLRTEQRVYAAQARSLALDALEAEATEVVVLVDGDDWLLAPDALETIRDLHRRRRLLAAYGNHVTSNGDLPTWAREYPLHAKITASQRTIGWLVSHPRSFRYGLWSHIEPCELRDERGKPLRAATDMALFLPILELAGTRSAFFPRPLYVYNRDNPGSRDRVDRPGQKLAARAVLARPPREALSIDQQRELLGA